MMDASATWPQIRDWRKQQRAALIERRMREIGQGLALGYGCEFAMHYEKRFPPTVNSAAETDFAAGVLRSIVGPDCVNAELEPTMGGEDFAYMLNAKQGAYLMLGTARSRDATSANASIWNRRDAGK